MTISARKKKLYFDKLAVRVISALWCDSFYSVWHWTKLKYLSTFLHAFYVCKVFRNLISVRHFFVHCCIWFFFLMKIWHVCYGENNEITLCATWWTSLWNGKNPKTFKLSIWHIYWQTCYINISLIFPW